MESEKLRLLLKTVELGSLSRAATAMGYTQSAASYAIQSLEEELGVTMLHRSKRGTQLTTDGAFLISYVRDCVSSVNKLYTTAHFIQGVQIGVLRVAAFSSIMITCLPEVIRRFHTAFPNITIDILSGTGRYAEMEEYLLNGTVDCSFVSLPVSPKLHCDELLVDQLYLILPLHHPLAAKSGPISFAELETLPFIMPADGKNEEITTLCREYNFTPKIAFTMSDDISIRHGRKRAGLHHYLRPDPEAFSLPRRHQGAGGTPAPHDLSCRPCRRGGLPAAVRFFIHGEGHAFRPPLRPVHQPPAGAGF